MVQLKPLLSYLLNCIMPFGSTNYNSVGAMITLAGKAVKVSDFEYSSAERKDAIEMLEGTLDADKLQALNILDNLACSAFSFDKTKSRIQAADSCKMAGLAWFSVINPIPDTRSKSILIASKVIHFLGLGAGHLYQEITDRKAAGSLIDFETCEKFLELQIYVCWLCVEVGKNKLFEDRNRMTDKVGQIMRAQFGAENTALSFLKAYNLALQRKCPIEVQQIFYEYALDNIKHNFYNTARPAIQLVTFYRDDLHSRLNTAMVNANETEEIKIRDEIEKMCKRELELFDRGHNVLDSNISYAGNTEQTHPSLRRRRKPLS